MSKVIGFNEVAYNTALSIQKQNEVALNSLKKELTKYFDDVDQERIKHEPFKYRNELVENKYRPISPGYLTTIELIDLYKLNFNGYNNTARELRREISTNPKDYNIIATNKQQIELNTICENLAESINQLVKLGYVDILTIGNVKRLTKGLVKPDISNLPTVKVNHLKIIETN